MSTNQVDPDSLSRVLQCHVANHPSALLVVSSNTAFESWFRVELAVSLFSLGFKREDLRFNYTYPGKSSKADLAFGQDRPIVFELKSFVCCADANKLREFPRQVALMEEYVSKGLFTQGIAFVTFYGYSDTRVSSMLFRFFSSDWQVSSPCPLLGGQPLMFAIASMQGVAR